MANEAASVARGEADGSAWSRFWFAPTPPTTLTVVRVFSGVLFALWLLSFLGHQEGYFTFQGWLDLRAFQAAQKQQESLPAPIDWSILYLVGDGGPLFHVLYFGAIATFLLFAAGVATRVTSVLSWLFVASFLASPTVSYEGDYLLGILAFYMAIGHLLLYQATPLSLLERLVGTKDQILFSDRLFGPAKSERPGSAAATWTLRLLQIHFVIIFMTSGFHKLQMGDWWSGAALWYPLHQPMQTTLETLRREKPSAEIAMFFLSLAAYAVIAWQIALPVFAWRRGWMARTVLLGGAAIGWLGSFFVYQLPLFGPFVTIGALSFVTADEWVSAKAYVFSLIGMRSPDAAPAVAREVKAPVLVGKETGIKK